MDELPLNQIICGDNCEVMRQWPSESVHCCVTSPPYWGLRDYGHERQIGLESTPEEYVARMVEVFREVRRVLRDDGTLWLNLGDSYASGGSGSFQETDKQRSNAGTLNGPIRSMNRVTGGLKSKDLCGIPWRVAFALQADGWYLRQDITWHKPNPMPESVRDRCTKAHEYVFLLAKSELYFYDAEAISEEAVQPGRVRTDKVGGVSHSERQQHSEGGCVSGYQTRNRRSVWTITTKPYSGAHFAVMPPDLVEPCIKAGCPEGGVVLDPFMGSGTVAEVARRMSCNYVGVELNPEYIEISKERLAQEVLF